MRSRTADADDLLQTALMAVVDAFPRYRGEASLKTWMTGSPIAIDVEASLYEAIVLMSDHSFRHLPVVDRAGQLVGVLALEDIRAALGSGVSHRTHPPSRSDGRLSSGR